MRDFQLVLPIPSTGEEMEALFPTRRSCLSAIIDARWPEGFACPGCGHARYWLHRKRPVIECARCGTQTSPLAGTLFANAKLPLPRLFRLCHVLALNPDTSESELAHGAGVSPPTAGFWKQKLRSRMALRNSADGSRLARTNRPVACVDDLLQGVKACRELRISITVGDTPRQRTVSGMRRRRAR